MIDFPTRPRELSSRRHPDQDQWPYRLSQEIHLDPAESHDPCSVPDMQEDYVKKCENGRKRLRQDMSYATSKNLENENPSTLGQELMVETKMEDDVIRFVVYRWCWSFVTLV